MRLSMIGERPDKDYSITSKQRWKWWEANVGKIISKGNFEFWEHLWQFAGLAPKCSHGLRIKSFHSSMCISVYVIVTMCIILCIIVCVDRGVHHCHCVHLMVNGRVSWVAGCSLTSFCLTKEISHFPPLAQHAIHFFLFWPKTHTQYTCNSHIRHSTFFSAPVFEVDNYCTADCKGSKFCI